MIFNNQLIQFSDVKKKVQHVTTKYLFPKIHAPQSLHHGEIITKSISKHNNNKDGIKQIDAKNKNITNSSMIVAKDQHFYSKNAKEILINPHKADINNLQIEKKNRLSHRDSINTKLRSTFGVRKSQNFHYNETQQRKDSTKCGKKSISHYIVVRELGHGGFATVFQVTDKDTGKNYAMKQYILSESLSCYHNQITVGEYFKFFSLKSDKTTQPIVQYIQKIRTGKKGYIIQQLGGQCLSRLISEIKGVFYNKQRVYQVRFLPFYERLKIKQYFLSVMQQICLGVKILNDAGFVHCDIKLQNILVQQSMNRQTNDLPIIKLIDFGSTFQSTNGLPKIVILSSNHFLQTITPEYMPPQLLMQFLKNNTIIDQQQQQLSQMIIYQKIDIWSIGCMMFEIFTGIPLWFKYKCKINYNNGRTRLELSIFALTNRDYSKMIKKQYQLCDNLVKTTHFVSQQWEKYRGLLKEILVVDPRKRISLETLLRKLGEMK